MCWVPRRAHGEACLGAGSYSTYWLRLSGKSPFRQSSDFISLRRLDKTNGLGHRRERWIEEALASAAQTKADRCNERSERRRAEIMLVCAPTGPSNCASEHAYLHDLL